MRNILWALPLGLLLAAGCGESHVEVVPAGGTVKFSDGTVPQGEVAIVNFTPVSKDKKSVNKGASGSIQPDGTFKLTTVEPGDGAIPGKYKAIVVVFKTYQGQESLVPGKYTNARTTPFEVTVESPGTNEFTFTLDKR